MENLIEENSKEKRQVDSDLKSAFQYNSIEELFITDIDDVKAAVYGENDGADWHWIVKLKNRKYAYIKGGCDYTGWDCQSSASVEKIGTLKEVVDAVPESEQYYKRGNLRNHLKLQLNHKMPFGLIEASSN